ncbi:hypothetical protein CRUP_014524, partial [Coryphaenoides rupestris]
MGSQVVQTLRQGVWASLTGGWYYDPDQNKFNNSCHLYLWIFLLMLPLSLHLALPPTTMALSIYCTSITVFFILIKLANYRLHLMFDQGEALVRSSLSDLSKAPEKKSNASDPCLPARIRKSSTVPDSVAMTMLVRNRPSPVIQVTVKQTETDSGLIGVECPKSDEVNNGEEQNRSTMEVVPGEGCLHPGQELSPEDLSSPNPDQATPLLQAQQRPSSRAGGGEDTRPGSASAGAEKQDVSSRTGCGGGGGTDREEADVQSPLTGTDRLLSERSRAVEREREMEQEREKEAGGETTDGREREAVDEGLPSSHGSSTSSSSSSSSSSCSGDGEGDEEREGNKENSDANNNSVAELRENLEFEEAEEAYCSDEIAVVLVDNSGSGGSELSAHLDDSDTEEGERARQEGAGSDDEPSPRLSQSSNHSEEFHLCRETTSSDSTVIERRPPDQQHLGLQLSDNDESCTQLSHDNVLSPLLTNDNSSSGVDVHSHHDDSNPPELSVDSEGFLRLPVAALGRYGPGGRTHIRGLSMDSGKDAVLLTERSQNTTVMTSSKSDLEAKEGQIPNESNFLEFKPSTSTKPSEAVAEKVRHRKRPTPPSSLATDSLQALPPARIPIVSPDSPQTDRDKDPDYDSLPSQTSQSESSMLQVICRPEATNKEEAYTFHTVHRDRPRKLYAERALNLPLGAELITGNMCDLLSTSSNSECQDGLVGGHTEGPFQRRIIPAHRLRPRRTHPEIFQRRPTRKLYYKLRLFPGKWVNILYDRLTLLALLDRNQEFWRTWSRSSWASWCLSWAFLLLNRGCYQDFWVFQFCLVIASCQYSLLK